MQESRVKKSLLNARINLICYFVSLVVAFFTRKIFLDRLGTEFIRIFASIIMCKGANAHIITLITLTN